MQRTSLLDLLRRRDRLSAVGREADAILEAVDEEHS